MALIAAIEMACLAGSGQEKLAKQGDYVRRELASSRTQLLLDQA